MSGIIPEIFGKPVVKDGVVMDTQVSLIPEIFGEPIVENGVVADVLLSESETEKYERQGQLFKESDVKRDEGGRFSTQAASGADEDEGEVIETSGAALRKNVEAGITAGEIDPSILLGDETLGIPRHDMPQIIDDNTTQFIKELTKLGRTVKDVDIPVGQLKGTQGELNMDKVNSLLDKMKAGKWNWDFQEEKVLASSDGHILDGHHRWAAQRLFDPNSSMPIIQVDLNISDLLDEAHAFDGVGYAGLEGRGVVESPDIQPSKAKVEWVDMEGEVDVDGERRFKKFFRGTGIKVKDIPSLIGAPDDAIVELSAEKDYTDEPETKDNIEIEVRWRLPVDPDETSWKSIFSSEESNVAAFGHRYFAYGEDGKLEMHNMEFQVLPEFRDRGIGTRVFSKQVEFCRKHGVARIGTDAMRDEMSDDFVGYKVWPRMGFDGIVNSRKHHHQAELPQSLLDKLTPEGGLEQSATDAFRLSHLLKFQEGREWWDEHGHTLPVMFDTSEGSQSNKVLDKYLRRKRAADKLPDKYARQDDPDGTPREDGAEEPDISPEELEMLEEVWEEIEQEMEDGGYTLEDSKDS